MLKNAKSHELHDEIISMTCKKPDTDIIYSKDKIFKDIFNLHQESWKLWVVFYS